MIRRPPGTALVAGAARIMPQGMVDFLWRHRAHPVPRLGRRLARRALGGGREGVEVARGPLAGYRFAFGDSFGMWLGGHEPAVHALLLERLRPGAVAYDVGAHVGYTALVMARAVAPGGKVIAFEPDASNRRRLADNVRLNRLEGTIECRPVALGEAVGTACLVRAEHHSGMTRVDVSGMTRVDVRGGNVRVSTLDAEAYGRGVPLPDLVLLDTEGAEPAILRGARRLLVERAPLIVCEYHDNREEVLSVLAPLGYHECTIDVSHALFERR